MLSSMLVSSSVGGIMPKLLSRFSLTSMASVAHGARTKRFDVGGIIIRVSVRVMVRWGNRHSTYGRTL